jgi:hypothetical protein
MKKQFRSFTSARTYVHTLKITNVRLWRKYCDSQNKPENIPKSPNYVYKKEWKNWMDWLGTDYIATQTRSFRDFESAREFVHKLKLQSTVDWKKYCKSGDKPSNIPSAPDKQYPKKWIDWADWLGHENDTRSQRKWRSFNLAREFVRKLGLKNQKEWLEFCKSNKRPIDIPAVPSRVYKKEWTTLGDWLGTGIIATQDRKYVSVTKAKKFVRKLGLKNNKNWREYCKSGDKPDEIPNNPWYIYKNKGWKGMGDWLGTGTLSPTEKSKNYLSSKEAKPVLKKLFKEYGIKNGMDWKKFAKTHGKLLDELHLPSAILLTYSKQNAEKKLKKKSLGTKK